MENNQKLYRVTLKGLTCDLGMYGISYIVAKDTDEAYRKVKNFLDENKIGLQKYRELNKVELIADTNKLNNVECMLHL